LRDDVRNDSKEFQDWKCDALVFNSDNIFYESNKTISQSLNLLNNLKRKREVLQSQSKRPKASSSIIINKRTKSIVHKPLTDANEKDELVEVSSDEDIDV